MPDCDIIISGGLVVDGTGSAPFPADVRIKDGVILEVGAATPAVSSGITIDASGLIVSPGFIDMMGQSEYSLLIDPRVLSKVMQGVTTEVTGEGTSPGPITPQLARARAASLQPNNATIDWESLGGYLDRLDSSEIGLNLACYVGATSVRACVLGAEDRKASPADLVRMCTLVADAMKQGAFGLSSALQYVPACFADTAELIALASVARAYGGIYATHQRSEADSIDDSLSEVFEIAQAANIPVEIFHLKTAFKQNWGRMDAVIERIEAVRANGLDITADVYPYAAASTSLVNCLPPWARTGGTAALFERLSSSAERERMRAEIQREDAAWENMYLGSGGAAGIAISSVTNPELQQYVGQRLDQIATARQQLPLDSLFDLLLADNAHTDAIYFMMDERDVRSALALPWTSICTDSSARAVDGPLAAARAHPRAWGTFPRVLGHYVRELGLISLEAAIHKMTGLAAQRVGIAQRGLLRRQYFADIVIFDAGTIADRATYEDPNHYPDGIRHVLINGEVVVQDGAHTGRLAGRALRKTQRG